MITRRWEISSMSVGDLHVQWGREGSGNITQGSLPTGGQVMFMPLTGTHTANGVSMNGRSVFVLRPGSEFTISVPDEHDWCSVYFPAHITHADVRQSRGERPPQGSYCSVLECSEQSMSHLRWIVLRLAQANAHEPSVLSAPASLRSIRQELIAAYQSATVPAVQPAERIGRPRRCRQDLMLLLRALIDERINDGLTVQDLTVAADVSERTLRNAFVDYFGIPPKQYLVTHRLHRVRKVLQTAKPDETTVTRIAVQFGFWHFGRFSAAYHRLFGELPSATLCDSSRKQLSMHANR